MASESAHSKPRVYSRYARDAASLLGQLIRAGRIERRLSVEELAERVGVSRDMMQRIEHGDPRCGIGFVFEAASVVGVALFDSDRDRLASRKTEQEARLHLLPKAVHKSRAGVKDDF